MAVLGRGYMIMHLFIIHLFCCLGWLCNVALAQLETVTGSANFPDIGIAVVGNFAVFVNSLLRGRLDLEMGARDVLATLRGPKLYDDINKGFGLTTCPPNPENRYREASVVMLSYNTPNSSMRQFMRYICNAYKVHSILLQCFPLKSKSADLLPGLCNGKSHGKNPECTCIVFWNVEEIVMMLAHRMPGTLKRLSDSLCLLPCPLCLATGCHGCNQGQLNVEETEEYGKKIKEDVDTEKGKKIKEDVDSEKGKKAVEDIFKFINSGNSMQGDLSCMCIPLSPNGYDYWTKLLIRSFGVREDGDRVYSTASLIVPRLTEIALNFILTVWFRVDGFSSSIVARRAIKDYVVDSKGSGFGASAFLVNAKAKNNNDCRVLIFRGTRLGIRTFSYIVGSVNLFCSICWAVLVGLQGKSIGKWYDNHSIPPSKARVVVIMAAIGIALCIDCAHLYLYLRKPSNSKEPTKNPESKQDKSSDSKEPTGEDQYRPSESTEPTVNLWFRPIAKVWSLLKVWFHSIIQVWYRLKQWFRPLIQVWYRLKEMFHPILKMVSNHPIDVMVVWAVIILETVCILSGIMVLGILGPKCFGAWLYSVLQVLVWVKWAVGSYLLGENPPEYSSHYEYDNGILVYSSAFLLNSLLAGVRGNWNYSLSFENDN